MSSYFDTSKPATMADLQRLYLGDSGLTPDQVQSQLQVNAPQAADWVHQAEMRYGINDASKHFATLQNAAQSAQMAQGATVQKPVYASDRARIAAQFNPQNEAAQIVTNRAQNLQRYNLPVNPYEGKRTVANVPYVSDALQPALQQAQPQVNLQSLVSPLQAQEAQRQGLTPYAYLMKQRVGDLANFTDSQGHQRTWINPTSQSAYNPKDLYDRPEFRTYMQQKPAEAAHVFAALTGQDLGQHQKIRAAESDLLAGREQERTKWMTEQSRKMAAEGTMMMDDSGQIFIRQFVNNPLDPSKSGRTGEYIPIKEEKSAVMQELARYLPSTFQGTAQLGIDKANKPSAVTPEQHYNPAIQNALQTSNYGQDSQGTQRTWPTNIGETIAGVGKQVGSFFTGDFTPQDSFMSPTGQTPNKVPKDLLSNPNFAKLSSEKQQRLVLAIQLGAGKGGGISQGYIPWGYSRR